MQKDTVLSLIRTVFTLIGSFLIGHVLWNGAPLMTETWDIAAGAIVTLSSTIWGIVDKSATIEMIQSGFRSVVIAIGGILVAAGYITGKTLDGILGFTAALIPVLQSYTSKKKVEAIHQGDLKTTVAGKVVKIVLFFIFSSCIVQGQSIFKPIPGPKFTSNNRQVMSTFNRMELAHVDIQTDSFWTGLRPVVGVAAYSQPGNQLMTGAGIGYQRNRWNYATEKWETLYSLNVLAWGAGSLSPGPQVPAFAFGPAVGLFNNLLIIGGGYDVTHGQWIGALSLGISLNN